MENETKDALRTAEGPFQTSLVSAKRSSNLSRLVGIFFQPKATFESISKNPNWQLPLALCVILALAATVTMINMIGIGTLMRMSLKDNPRADEIVEMAEESIATKAMYYVPAVVSTPIIILAIAGIFLMIFNLGGKESNFKKVLSVVAHSHFAYALVTSTLFILVVTFRADRGTLDIQNPLAFNLGFFLSHGETSKFLMSLASLFPGCAQLLVLVSLNDRICLGLFQPELARRGGYGGLPLVRLCSRQICNSSCIWSGVKLGRCLVLLGSSRRASWK